MSEVDVNVSKVQLNQSTILKIDEQMNLLREQTKLTETQIEELGWTMKEIAARIQVHNANAFNLRQLGFFNMARTAGQNLQNSFMAQTMPYRVSNERFKSKTSQLNYAQDYQSFDYIVTQEKFKSMSAREQYKVLEKFLYRQSYANFLKTVGDVSSFKFMGTDVGKGAFVGSNLLGNPGYQDLLNWDGR